MLNFFKSQKMDKTIYTYSDKQIEGITKGALSMMVDLLRLISDSREKLKLLGENGIDDDVLSEMLDELGKIIVKADSTILPPTKPKTWEKTTSLTETNYNRYVKTHLDFIIAPGEISKNLAEIVAGGATNSGKIYSYLISALDAAFHLWWLKTSGYEDNT